MPSPCRCSLDRRVDARGEEQEQYHRGSARLDHMQVLGTTKAATGTPTGTRSTPLAELRFGCRFVVVSCAFRSAEPAARREVRKCAMRKWRETRDGRAPAPARIGTVNLFDRAPCRG